MKTEVVKCGCEVSALKKDKAKSKCSVCSFEFCNSHIYFYVDESNIAITKSAPPLCFDCYKQRHKY